MRATFITCSLMLGTFAGAAEIIVWYTIGIDGRVVDVEIANAEPRGVFEGATVAAVAQWTWAPVADKYGVAIEVRSSSLIEFLMESESN